MVYHCHPLAICGIFAWTTTSSEAHVSGYYYYQYSYYKVSNMLVQALCPLVDPT